LTKKALAEPRATQKQKRLDEVAVSLNYFLDVQVSETFFTSVTLKDWDVVLPDALAELPVVLLDEDPEGFDAEGELEAEADLLPFTLTSSFTCLLRSESLPVNW
jgi:hypothetical protein